MIAEVIFSIAPRNFLDNDTFTLRTTDPAHGIAEENAISPHRNELEQPYRQSVITGRRHPADAAKRFAVGSRLEFHDDGIFPFVKLRFSYAKAFEIQTIIEYSFQAHGSS